MQPPDLINRTRSYWVRSFDPEKQTYLLARVGAKINEPLLAVKVDRDGDRTKVSDALQAALDHNNQGAEPVRLVMRKGQKVDKNGDPVGPSENLAHQVVANGLSKDRDSRKILDKEGEHISTWTTDLDSAVLKHSEADFYETAMAQQKTIMMDPVFFASVRTRAVALMVEKLSHDKANGVKNLPEINGAKFDQYVPANCMAAFRGNETHGLAGKKALRQRRYDTSLSFGEQTGQPNYSADGNTMSQLGNYAMQQAIVDTLAEACEFAIEKDGRYASRAEVTQDNLLSRNILVAGHPKKTPADFRLETQESARIYGALALAGVQEAGGAEPAKQGCDPLKRIDLMSGEPVERFLMHRQVKIDSVDKMAPDAAPEQKIQSYIMVGEDRAKQYRKSWEKRVEAVQLSVIPKSKKKPEEKVKPKPPSDIENAIDGAKSAAGGVAVGMEGAVKSVGQMIPFPGL